MEEQELQNLFRYFDERTELYISRLSDAVAIPSVSGYPERRADCVKMMEWMKQKLESLSCDCWLEGIGDQTLPDGSTLPLTPVLLAQYGSDPQKKTILVYCHLDVQPAAKEDGWDTDPFMLTRVGDLLYGRGASDDKGPAIGWYNCLEAMTNLKIDVPVNIKFLFEGMEEETTAGLDTFIQGQREGYLKFLFEGMEECASMGMNRYVPTIRNTYLKDVDYICVADTRWLGKTKHCMAYGLRGLAYFQVEITGPNKDLHSGVYGGSVYEPMSDVIAILDSLIDKQGKLLIEGIYDAVAPLTEQEKVLYTDVQFDEKEFAADIGVKKMVYDSKIDTLLHVWRYPSLSIHGIHGADHTTSMRTSIPHKVTGKFSIRLVPNMGMDTEEIVRTHVMKILQDRGSPNVCRVTADIGLPLYTDFNSAHFQAACTASTKVYGSRPDLVRQGGCVPVCALLQSAVTSGDVVLMPVGRGDDNAHAQNEKIDLSNYMNGMKLMATYLSEVGKL